MLPNFVSKGAVTSQNCLTLGGRLVLEQFEEARTYLIEKVDREAAALFAEPVVTRRGDATDIAWYSEQAGQPVPLEALDPDARNIVAGRLKARLDAIGPLLSGPHGDLLGRMLYVPSPENVTSIGLEPLLIQWSILPDDLSVSDQSALDAHFARTLGRYTSLAAPKIGRRSAPTSPPVGASAVPRPLADDPVIPRNSSPRQGLGLAVATGASALVALLLAVPGVLGTPQPASHAGDTLTDAQKITKAMEDKVAQARGALAVATCDPNGGFTAPKDREGQLPPPPVPIRPGENHAGGDLSGVARRASESVVFIFTCTDKGTWDEVHKEDKEPAKPLACPKIGGGAPPQGAEPNLFLLGSGSGFFVAPKTIVTNFHVVRHALAVYATSETIGRATPVTIEATTPAGTGFTSPDFALLRIDLPSSPAPIELSTAPSLLQNVVAAGFPGVVINEDIDKERLFHGDLSAVPGLTTFPGAVTLIKYPNQPMQLIYSSAVIGHGNSGGPLLDLCARAIGMNTFGWSGTAEDTGYKVNIAEGAKALSAFLDAHNVTHQHSDTACSPQSEARLDKPTPPSRLEPTPPSPPVTPLR